MVEAKFTMKQEEDVLRMVRSLKMMIVVLKLYKKKLLLFHTFKQKKKRFDRMMKMIDEMQGTAAIFFVLFDEKFFFSVWGLWSTTNTMV